MCRCLVTDYCAINIIALTHSLIHTYSCTQSSFHKWGPRNNSQHRAHDGIRLLVSGDLGQGQSLVGLGENHPVTSFPTPPQIPQHPYPLLSHLQHHLPNYSNTKSGTLNERPLCLIRRFCGTIFTLFMHNAKTQSIATVRQ